MNLLKKLFGKKAPVPQVEVNSSGFEKRSKEDWDTFEALFEQHAVLSFEKQLLLEEIIQSNSWQLDMETGSISFGPKLAFPIQIIGSLSFEDNTWMWAWANTQSDIPENLLVQSHKLKNMGEKKQIKELTEGHFSVEEWFEHKIGMIACGLFKAKSYYCANYGKGTLVVTIASDQIPSIDQNPPGKVLSVFPQFISALRVNHRKAFLNYLIDKGFQLKVEASKIEGTNNGETVVAEFDEASRMTNLNGKIGGNNTP